MSDLRNENQAPAVSPNSRITSLSTLRALQKAAKQLAPSRNESDDNQKKNDGIKERPEQKDRTSPSPNKKAKLPRTPDDINAYDLRQSFQKALSKLYTNETKESALNELKTIIMNNVSPRNLRTFLSSLTEYKKVASPTTQEIEVHLMGFIAMQFKENLIDPLDKTPSLMKTCFRIIDAIHAYFKVPAQNVTQACGSSLRQIYLSSLLRENVENKTLLLYEPLAIIISGGTDRISQATASYCLCDLLIAMLEAKDSEFLEDIRPKFINTFLKVNYEIPDMITAMGILLKSTDIRLNGSKLHKLIEKLIKYTQSNSTTHVIKVEVSNVLNILATKLFGVAESFIGNLHEEVITTLKSLSKDRVIKVQNAANDALRAWTNLKNELQNLEAKKMTRDVVENNPDKLIKLRTGIDINQEEDIGKLIENMDVPLNAQNGSEYDNMEEGQEFIAGKLKKGLKKKSGIGGGFVLLDKDKRPSSAALATENKKKQNIRDQIQRSAVEGSSQRDKFDMQVRFPGQEYIQASAPGLQAQQSPTIQMVRPKTSNEPAQNLREAADQARKERRMELTQQLMALHTQGFIKNLPTEELISSIENSNDIFPSGAYPLARSSQGMQYNQRSQMDPSYSKGFHALHGTQDLRQYEMTNALSQEFETMPLSSKEQKMMENRGNRMEENLSRQDDNRKFFETQSSRVQKDYIIRQSKPQNTSSQARINNNPQQGSQLQQTLASQLHQTLAKEFRDLKENFDLEDTMPYDLQRESTAYNPAKSSAGETSAKFWDQVLKDLDRNDLQGAFEKTLESGDDIYLMRLMSKTGPCLEQLNRKTALAVTNRIAKLANANFMENVFLDVMGEGFDLQLTDQLTIEDQKQLLEELYTISADEDTNGNKATNLYSVLLTSMNK